MLSGRVGLALSLRYLLRLQRMQNNATTIRAIAGSSAAAAVGGSPRIEIDGSEGEGGGQVLRNSISYANILRKEIRVFNIRAGRAKPGLKAQHIAGLQLATAVCGGSLSGDEMNSSEIHYTPSSPSTQATTEEATTTEPRVLKGEINTAGSIILLLQAAVPCALLGPPGRPCHLLLKGGTNASMAPQYDYWERVFWPTLRDRCGLAPNQMQAKVIRRGYFPKGGGEVEVHIDPLKRTLQPFKLTERGDVKKIQIRSFHAGKLPRHLAEEMAKSANALLQQNIKGADFETEVVKEPEAIGSALGILVVATTSTGCLLAGSALSTPKKKAKDVGIEAANELLQTLQEGGCVDEWLQDQLILYAALAEGTSEILTGSMTLHTRTAIMVAEQMTAAKFEVTKLNDIDQQATNVGSQDGVAKDGRVSGRHLIRCRGIGFLEKS